MCQIVKSFSLSNGDDYLNVNNKHDSVNISLKHICSGLDISLDYDSARELHAFLGSLIESRKNIIDLGEQDFKRAI